MKKFLLFVSLFLSIGSISVFASNEYATWNQLDKSINIILSSINLIETNISGPGADSVRSTISVGPNSGKWYWESTVGGAITNHIIGVMNSSASLNGFPGLDSNGWGYYFNGSKYNNDTLLPYGTPYAIGDVIGVALDYSGPTASITFYKNGVSQGVAYSGLTGYLFAGNGQIIDASTTANFGPSITTPPGYNAGLYTVIELPSCSSTIPSCYGLSNCSTTFGTPSFENQSWVVDAPSCGLTCLNGFTGSACEIPPSVPITGYFTSPVSVSSGSYNWTMILNSSMSGVITDLSGVYLWDAFKIDSIIPFGDTFVFSLSPSTGALNVECTTYTVSVPSSLIQGNDGYSTNPDTITGSFTVTGCPDIVPPVDTGSTSSGVTFSDTGSLYLSIFEVHDGVYFFNIWGVLYIVVLSSIVLAIFYGLFRFYINFMLGKKGRN